MKIHSTNHSPGKFTIGVGVAIGVGIEVLSRRFFDPDTDTDSDADETLITIFIPRGRILPVAYS